MLLERIRLSCLVHGLRYVREETMDEVWYQQASQKQQTKGDVMVDARSCFRFASPDPWSGV